MFGAQHRPRIRPGTCSENQICGRTSPNRQAEQGNRRQGINGELGVLVLSLISMKPVSCLGGVISTQRTKLKLVSCLRGDHSSRQTQYHMLAAFIRDRFGRKVRRNNTLTCHSFKDHISKSFPVPWRHVCCASNVQPIVEEARSFSPKVQGEDPKQRSGF